MTGVASAAPCAGGREGGCEDEANGSQGERREVMVEGFVERAMCCSGPQAKSDGTPLVGRRGQA